MKTRSSQPARRNLSSWLCTFLPFIVLAAASEAQGRESYFYVANTRPPDAFLSLRTEPSARSGQRLSEMSNGTKLKVLQKREDGWWLVQVIPSGEKGWALSGQGSQKWIDCCIVEHADTASPTAPTDRETNPSRRLTREEIGEQRRERANLSQTRAKDRYMEHLRQQAAQREAAEKQAVAERDMGAQIDALPTDPSAEERIREFCRTALRSQELSVAGRAGIYSRCRSKLESLAFRKKQQQEEVSAQQSHLSVGELVAKVEQMPNTEQTVAELTRLSSNNSYRLSNLTFPDQNTYYAAIMRKLQSAQNALADITCQDLVSKLPVPERLNGAVVLDGLAGVSLTQFLCGAMVASRNVSVTGADHSFQVKINEVALNFDIVRYLKQQQTAVPDDSPIQGGVPALALRSVIQAGRQISVTNAGAMVVNIYSQWTPQLSVYLQQHHH